MTKRISNRKLHIIKYNQRKHAAYGIPLFEQVAKIIRAKKEMINFMYRIVLRG